MAKKRGNNEGSIYRRPNGSWRAQITLDGKRLGFTGRTRTECQEWLKKTIYQIDNGMTYASTVKSIGEFSSAWLSNKRNSIRSSTWQQYNQITQDYILPFIGKLKLRDLRPEHVQDLYKRLIENRIGISAIQKTHTVLRSMLTSAVRMGLILRNPASVIQPPKEPEKEMQILGETEVNHLLMSIQNHRWKALYHLAVTTGMRQMELLGLKWDDLDWRKRTLKVERQLLRPNGEGIKFSTPKTKSGKRTISLGSKTIEILRDHYNQQQEERLTAGDQWQEHNLIFTNHFGGPIDHRNLVRDFKRVLKEAGLPNIRFHDLRHTAASLMLKHNVPPNIISKRLGHARISITLDIYSHIFPGMQEEAAEMIDELITPIQLHPVAPGCTKIESNP